MKKFKKMLAILSERLDAYGGREKGLEISARIEAVLEKLTAKFGGAACEPRPTKPPFLKGLPSDLPAVEDSPSALDLSGVKFKKFGSNRETIVLTLQVEEGTLNAGPGRRIEINGDGSDTIEISGRRSDIRKYLKDAEAITYTSAPDDFGDNADTLSLSVTKGGVEYALGSVGVDIEDVSDDQIGTPGDDQLIGDRGRNTLNGLAGDDTLLGLAGDDSLNGGEGDDVIRGGEGADTLEGGADNDILQYTDSSAGVNVNLTEDASGFQQASGGDAEGDVISGFENVYSSEFDDTVTGNDERNILFGYGGDDVLNGLGGDDVIRGDAGADTMDGGDGSDWLRYVDSQAGVSIDLTADSSGFQQASGGDAQGDVISNFENFQGSEAGDTVVGNDEANYLIGNGGADDLSGGDGRDIIRGGADGDTLDGGDGTDTLQYTGSSAGVTVSLVEDTNGFQSASGGDAQGDVLSGFENVYASNEDDTLTGNAARNILYGYAGEDILNGGEGNDVLRGGADADSYVFDTALALDNVDRIIDFDAAEDTIVLDSLIFTSLSTGALGTSNFHTNGSGLAEDAAHFVIYDSATGDLYYDADGLGGGDGIAFATLGSIPTIDAGDFSIV